MAAFGKESEPQLPANGRPNEVETGGCQKHYQGCAGYECYRRKVVFLTHSANSLLLLSKVDALPTGLMVSLRPAADRRPHRLLLTRHKLLHQCAEVEASSLLQGRVFDQGLDMLTKQMLHWLVEPLLGLNNV